MKLIVERIANRANFCIGKLYRANEGSLPEGESGERGQYLCDTLEPHDAGFPIYWRSHCSLNTKQLVFIFANYSDIIYHGDAISGFLFLI